MRNKKISVTIFLITTIIAGSIDAQAASVSLNMTSAEVFIGQTMDVDVVVDPEGSDIAGVQLDVIFDRNIIEPVAVKEGNFLNQDGASTLFLDMSHGSNHISSIAGLILGNSNVTHRNVFATITFKAKSGGASFIDCKNVKVSTSRGDLLKTKISSGATLNILYNENEKGNPGNRGGGGGGGGGGGTSGEEFSNIRIQEKHERFINKDLATSYIFKTADPILSVNITGKVNAGEINVAVEILRNTSSLVKEPAPDIVYMNANIWVGTYGFATPANIKNAGIAFRVPVSWIESNRVDPDSITMMHYQGVWAALPTKKMRETSEWIYYEASTTSFSPHAITGKKSTGSNYSGMNQTPVSQQMQKSMNTGGNHNGTPGSSDDLGKYLMVGAFIGIAINAALIRIFSE